MRRTAAPPQLAHQQDSLQSSVSPIVPGFFVRQAIDFYYPRAVHRSLIADVGIMTPNQAAKNLVSYSRRHRELHFSVFVIPQVEGTVPRSTQVRSDAGSRWSSRKGMRCRSLPWRRCILPLEGALASAWIEGGRFDPRRARRAFGFVTAAGCDRGRIGVEPGRFPKHRWTNLTKRFLPSESTFPFPGTFHNAETCRRRL